VLVDVVLMLDELVLHLLLQVSKLQGMVNETSSHQFQSTL
jgi:hypothetical protein